MWHVACRSDAAHRWLPELVATVGMVAELGSSVRSLRIAKAAEIACIHIGSRWRWLWDLKRPAGGRDRRRAPFATALIVESAWILLVRAIFDAAVDLAIV
jgi:hypothetical protein